MTMVTVGLDIAKQIFQVHGVDRTGKVVLRKRLRGSRSLHSLPNVNLV
jgi:transposase